MSTQIGKFKPAVTLDGEANVFELIGKCTRAARSARWTDAQIAEFQSRITATESYEAAKEFIDEQFDVSWD